MQALFAVATVSIAIAGLIVSISARRQVAIRRKFEILLERGDLQAQEHRDAIRAETAKREDNTRELVDRIDREAAKRETEPRAFLEWMARRFELVKVRRNRVAWPPMENAGPESRIEPEPKAGRGLRHRETSGPSSRTGETEAVAAQAVPPDEVSE